MTGGRLIGLSPSAFPLDLDTFGHCPHCPNSTAIASCARIVGVSIKTNVLTIQFSSMEHDAFHVPYLLDTTPEAAFHGQAVKTVAYLRVSTTQQVLGPEARPPEGLAGRLTARWQAGRYPALPRTGRFQDRHRQDHGRVPYHPLQLHEHPRAQAEPLACISTRILSVPWLGPRKRS